MKNRKRLILLILAVLVVGAVMYVYVKSRSSRDPNLIRVSGNIEVTDVALAFKIPGLVQDRHVSEGDLVRKGDTVAILDASDLAQEVAMRKAELQAAQSQLAELKAGSRPEEIAAAQAAVTRAQAFLSQLEAGSRPQEIASAEANVAKAEAELAVTESEYRRREELHRKEAISTQEFEVAKGAYEMAKARLQAAGEELKLVKEGPREEEIEQAKAALAEAQEKMNLVSAGPRKETIDQARAKVQLAKESLGLAETRVEYATLSSPISGVVLSEHVEPGEYVAAGTPVVTIANLDRVWLRAYINETDLGRVKLGQTVRVTTDTYPDKQYEGRITFISSQAEFTPKNVQTEKERVKLVYRIKVDIPNPRMELKPGMPADGDILIAP